MSFFGPPDGPAPFSESIVVYRHGPKTGMPTPESFFASRATAGVPAMPRTVAVGRQQGLEASYDTVVNSPHFSGGRQALSNRAVLITDADGYWAFVHTWPTAISPRSRVLDGVLETFHPKP